MEAVGDEDHEKRAETAQDEGRHKGWEETCRERKGKMSKLLNVLQINGISFATFCHQVDVKPHENKVHSNHSVMYCL